MSPAPGEAEGTPALLALDFGGSKIDIALAPCGREGGRVETRRRRIETEASSGASQAVGRALATADELVEEEGAVVLAVGVATMGYTKEDRVEHAPNVPGWDALKLPSVLRDAFPRVPVVIENDVRAAALAELRRGALRGVRTGLYVNLGTGVAATVVIDGKVFTGAHGLAGEIGYSVATLADGSTAQLEAEFGGGGVRRQAAALGLDAGLRELLASRDEVHVDLGEYVLATLATAITNTVLVVDPERVVLGGGYVGAGERLLAAVRGALERSVPYAVEVVIGEFGPAAALEGALVLAAEATRRQ